MLPLNDRLFSSGRAAIESLQAEADAARRDLDLAGSASKQLAELRSRTDALTQERDALRRDLEDARYKLAEAQFALEQPPAKPLLQESQ